MDAALSDEITSHPPKDHRVYRLTKQPAASHFLETSENPNNTFHALQSSCYHVSYLHTTSQIHNLFCLSVSLQSHAETDSLSPRPMDAEVKPIWAKPRRIEG